MQAKWPVVTSQIFLEQIFKTSICPLISGTARKCLIIVAHQPACIRSKKEHLSSLNLLAVLYFVHKNQFPTAVPVIGISWYILIGTHLFISLSCIFPHFSTKLKAARGKHIGFVKLHIYKGPSLIFFLCSDLSIFVSEHFASKSISLPPIYLNVVQLVKCYHLQWRYKSCSRLRLFVLVLEWIRYTVHVLGSVLG